MAGITDPGIYSATYSNVPVYEFKIDGESIMRRRADDWINATHILKAAGFDKPARTRILEREVQKGVHEKVQGGYGKYQGTWIPLQDGRMLAERNNIIDKLRPIFDYVAGDRSPPPAPKHSTSSRPRASRGAVHTRKEASHETSFNAVKPHMSMGPPSFHLEQYDVNPAMDEDESIEQTTLESSSMMADEDALPMSQHGTYLRKRKRGMNDATAMSIREQEHILYGDQLLDYFMTVGDAPEARRIPPPEPPVNFQVDRPIDDSGNTALHWACAMGDLEIVRDLLVRGADVKALSVHEETPLVRAVLFTNNYEKRTFPELLELLLDTISFRDWFGATIFHHIAETTRSKGKWKSSRYYCEVLLETLRSTCSQEEIDLLLSCQDSNGDTAALVAARNGAFRLVNILLMYCPRAGDLVNKKGETAAGILARAHYPEREIPPPPSSVVIGNDQMDGDGARPTSSDHQLAIQPPSVSLATSALTSKIESIMAEANKKLAATYGNSRANQPESGDVANPEALYEQLESDRRNIQRQTSSLVAKEAASEPVETQLGRYEQLRRSYESLLEQIQHAHLAERMMSMAPPVTDKPRSPPSANNDLVAIYQLSRQLCSAQKARRAAIKDLIQQTADAGVSTKFDVHRKLVSLATGLKEEELDPMSAELAETLEFERMNGKGSSAESPEPDRQRQLLRKESTSLAVPSGPTVSVDA
ncbi:hypothetical protein MPDQ_005855 [Monascus purpureus]|uniref:Cell pattern formation-associated protein stuA n=1 Tax=Monascus purpureus TaxID=5098 RepID=A0A507QZS6_MONPU|nr:hypothetical protein MPDQ_005855 [Monascus purpureus]